MRLISSADGTTARLRIPGGRIGAGDFADLVAAAAEGEGHLHTTSRGNIELRGLSGAPGVDLGPDRDVIASPLSPVCAQVARELASLLPADAPLVAVDDGSGDMLAHGPRHGLSLVGVNQARVYGDGQVVGLMQAVQRVAALCDGQDAGRADLPAEEREAPLGWLERPDGLVDLGGVSAFGVIPRKVAQLITVLEVDVSVTPWRTFVLHGLEPGAAEAAVRVLAPLGVSFDAATDLVRISACIGAPACHRGLSDVRADAFRSGAQGRVHFVGCAKACGRPKTPHTEYLATGEGEYEVTAR